MTLAVLANEMQKDEISASPFFQKHKVLFSEKISLREDPETDALLDLCFDHTPDSIAKLSKWLPKPVLVNSVTETLDRIHPEFIRINGWPGFLKGKCLEAAGSEVRRLSSAKIFGDHLVFVKDTPGFVSARIVAMIINEAYFTWEAGTSSKDEIDMAMKLGTGYPYGPFEWAGLIGVSRVMELLERLSGENPLYIMASSLK
jgi:3-hydroxybutyryl-CoA dehydrogenase